MKKRNKFFAFYFLFLIFYSLVFFEVTEAARLELKSDFNKFNKGDRFQISFVLNTENEKINAVEGEIKFPNELLELKEIRDGSSIINFWIEKPRIGDRVYFSGITPGGYLGENGFIFSMIFETKKEGEGVIEIQNSKALISDGKGTSAQLKVSNFQFVILKDAVDLESKILESTDTIPPEDFTAEIAQDPDVFEGKYFLVFATQDKESGIDHYEILETKNQKIEGKRWLRAESPYLLGDQKLRSYIYVKAVDKAGNERIIMIKPKYPLYWYENWRNWVIIIMAILISGLIFRLAKNMFRLLKK